MHSKWCLVLLATLMVGCASNEKIDRLTADIQTLNGKVAQLQQDIDTLRPEVAAVKDEAEKVTTRLDDANIPGRVVFCPTLRAGSASS